MAAVGGGRGARPFLLLVPGRATEQLDVARWMDGKHRWICRDPCGEVKGPVEGHHEVAVTERDTTIKIDVGGAERLKVPG